tara:strand:+ start:5356 stop:5865 length:510 start_codon:yes stop_codon:yes gene_type:complete
MRMFLFSTFALVFCMMSAGSAPRAAETVAQADRIVIEKTAHRMVLYHGGNILKSYWVALGGGGLDPKKREGDGRTPEGIYKITERKADSRFHLALRISYPDEKDKARAKAQGVPPGSHIMIHGMRNGFGWLSPFNTWFDWTDGCVAITNAQMNEIWERVPVGTEVEIQH